MQTQNTLTHTHSIPSVLPASVSYDATNDNSNEEDFG